MEYLQKFKNYLLALQPTPTDVTVKNYSLDVKHFISWFEAKYHMAFSPKDITAEHIALFRSEKNSQLSFRSLDRHVSSLRKFFHFLKLQGIVGTSPLEKTQGSRVNEDPYHFKEFKDFLYVYNASNLTIKNYIIDLKQFFKWLEDQAATQAPALQGATDMLSSLTNDMLAAYRDALVAENVFSYASINRKLSSLRKYIAWAGSQNLLENQSGLPINPNAVENLPSARHIDMPNRAQNGIKATSVVASLPETANKLSQQAPFSHETTPKEAKYSPFPPFRLAQKISKGINVVFDGVFIAPLSHAVLSAHKMLWRIQGKPLFVTKPGTLPVKFTRPAFVKNISKAFAHPESISVKYFPWYQKIWHHTRYTRPNWYKRYHSHAIAHYFNWAILMIVMSIIGFGFYNNFASRPQTGQHLLAAAQPNRILSFQGRLTDSSNNAITKATNLRFAIYTDATSTGSALLWQEVDNVTPDANGVFSVLLGKNSTIQQALFANNANLYLGITVEQTAELTPRQQLATVAYATNAETLQGLPPITQSGAGTSNVVLALNSAGNLSIGAASTFQTVGGAFTLSGDTLVLNTNAGTNGNITVAPDGQGFIDLQKPLVNTTQNNNIPSSAGSVEVDDTMAILATNSGVAALTINQNSTGALFTASASGVSKFTIANSGAVTDTNYTTAGGIFYADGTGLLLQTAAGSTGECLTSSGGGTPTWGTCGTGGGGSSFWTLTNGALYPVNTTLDVLFGGSSSSSANFAFINNTPGSGTPTASISGNLTLNAAGVIQTTNNQQLTIGGGTTGNIVLKPLNGVGGTVTISGLATGVVHSTAGVLSASSVNLATEVTGILPLTNGGTNNSLTPSNGGIVYSDSTRLQILSGTVTAGQCLTSGSSSAPSWSNCATAAGVNNYWTIASGALYPVNTTLDVLFGGTSSSSANFAFINNAAGVPTASVSGNLTLNSNGVIQTTNNRLLTIGGTTTGAISFASNIASDLLPATTDTYNLGSAALEWNNLYVKNIISTGSTAGFWQRNLGVLAPLATSDDLAVGGASTASAKFQIFGNTGNATTAGTLTFDGTGNLIQTTRNQGLTIGGDTTGNITLKPLNGNGTVTITGLGTGVVHATSGLLSTSQVVLTSEVTGTLPIANGGTNTNTIGSAGRVVYSNGTNYAFTAVGSTGECLTSQGSGTPTWTSCSSAAGATNYWTLDNGLGILYPINTTLDVLFGGTSSSSANFAFLNDAPGSGTPTASISGNLTLNSNGIIATTNERPLTIGNSQTGSVELAPKGTTGLVVNGTGNVGIGITDTSSFQLQVAGNVGPNATDTYDLGSAALEWNNLYVKNIISSGSFAGFWQRNLGILSPANITDDLAIGGTATSSAKFQIFGNTGNATTTGTLTFTGGGSQIQTTSNQTLTLGGNTTGNIILKPNNGGGTVTVNGSALDSAGSTFNAFTTNATTLNVGVTGGTTTVNSALTATGIFTANNTAYLNGDVNLGNASADTITATGRFASSLIPKTDNTYDLGDSATPLRWRNLYLSGNYGGFWQRFNGILAPLNITDDLAIGGTSTSSAKFQIFGNTGNATTTGTLTFTGTGSQIQTTSNQTLTLGGNTTGTVAFGSNIGSDFIPQTTDLYNLGSITNEWNTLYVKNIVTSGNTAGFWQRNLGALSPSNITDDLLAGGTATNSAKFAVLNMTGTGTPVASVSSGISGTGMYFAADGTIQTVRNAGLTIGGTSTGNITLSPLAGGTGSTINLNAATLATNQTSVNLLNTTATTINFGGAATTANAFINGTTIHFGDSAASNTISIGATAGTTTVNNALTVTGIFTANNNVILGASSSNTIDPKGVFSESLIPQSTSINLGAATAYYGSAYITNLFPSSSSQYMGFWQLNSGALSPTNITNDILAGGTATNSAKFAVLNMTGTGTPVASVSSGLSGTALYISADGSIQTVRDETLTLGGTTTGNISFANNVSSDILPYRSNIYSLGSSSLQWLNLYAQNIFQDGQPITQTWQRNLGVLAPLNITDDLAVGGTSTSSAKYQIFGNTGNATTTGTLTFNSGAQAGNLIASRDNQGLTIGDSQTGNIIFNGGNVGIATTNPTEKLTVNGNILASIYKDLENPSYYLDAGNASNSLIVAGNVGIATLTPQNKLDVNGAVIIGSYAGVNTAPLNGLAVSGFAGFGTTAVGNGALVVNQTNLSGLGDILAASASGTTKFMINNDGTVGIANNVTDATTLTKSALDVRKDSFGNALTLFKQLSTDVNADIITASNSAGQTEFRLTNTGIIQARSFQDLDSTSYFLDPAASGNSLIVAGTVGVGTINPLIASGIDIEKDGKGNAALIVNQTSTTNAGDIFTASSSGVTKFTIQNDGTLIAKKYTTQNGILYLSDTNGTVAQTAQGAAHTFLRGNGALAPTFNAIDLSTADVTNVLTVDKGGLGANVTPAGAGELLYSNSATTYTHLAAAGSAGLCLTSNGAAAPSWTSCSGAASNWWNVSNGALYPINNTLDFFIGGQATTSAKFSVLNVDPGTGTPVASISSGVNGVSAYLSATGTLATTNMQPLTLGNNTTGAINIGTDATDRTITIGNTTGINALDLIAGTGKINLNAAAIDDNQSTVTVFGTPTALTIGNSSGTTTFASNVDSSKAILTLLATPTTVNEGSVSQTFNVLGNFTAGALSADLIPTGNGSINLGSPTHYYNTVYANTFISPVSGGVSGFWQLSNNVLSPVNAWNDLAVGGNATGSATPWQVFATTVGVNTAGTATTSGNLTFRGDPTQSLTRKVNILNGASLGFYPSVGGDSNTSVFTIANDGTLTATGTFNLNSGILATSQTSASLFLTANSINIGTSGTGGGIGIGNSTSTSTFHGTIQLGDSGTNTINPVAHFSNDLIPDSTNSRSLGTASLEWKDLFLSGALTASNVYLPVTGGVGGYWTLSSNVIYPTNNWNDLAIGGTSTSSAKYQIFGNTGNATTTGTLTFNSGAQAGNLIASRDNQGLTIGDSQTGQILFGGGNIGIGTTNPINFKLQVAGNVGPDADNSYDLGSNTIRWRNLFLSGNYGGFWQRFNGAVSPYNITDDILAGATATTSAKFAVLNMTGSGTPTASVSSGLSGTGMYFDANGNVQTVRNMGITIGGATTGNITLKPLNGGTGAAINSFGSIIPSAADTWNLGSISNEWDTLYVRQIVTPSSGGLAGFWQLSVGGVLAPANITNDLAIGGAATYSAAFHVYGTTQGTIAAGTASTAADLTFTGSNVSNAAGVNLLNNSALGFYTSYGGDAGLSTTPSLYIAKSGSNSNGAGFVGIQTNNPAGPLDVYQADTNTSYFRRAAATAQNIGIINGGNGNIILGNSSSGNGKYLILASNPNSVGISFRTNTTDGSNNTRMVIDNYSHVGVGTTAMGNAALAVNQLDLSGLGDLFTASAAGTTQFTINNNGNVAIGPSYTTAQGILDVASSGVNLPSDLTLGLPATTNLITNPSFENNSSTGWTLAASTTISTDRAVFGQYSVKNVGSASTNYHTAGNCVTDPGSTNYAVSDYTYLVSGYSGTNQIRIEEYTSSNCSTGGSITHSFAGATATGQWQRVTNTFTTASGTRSFNIFWSNLFNAGQSGTSYGDGFQLEKGTSATPYLDGSLGPGYSWTGTPNNSTSVRNGGAAFAYNTFNSANGLGAASGGFAPTLQLDQNGTGDIIAASASGTPEFQVSNAGVVTARSFQDLDNTAYFIDPAASGIAGTFNGSVGIGTTSPLSQLEVASTISTAPRGIMTSQYSNDTAAAVLELAKSRGTTPGSYTAVQSGDTLGNLQFMGANGSAFANGAYIRAFADQTWTTGAEGSYMTFGTTADGATSSTERLRIDNAGNVGIATSTPSARLTIVGPDTNGTDTLQIKDSLQSGYLFAAYHSTGVTTPYANIGAWSASNNSYENLVVPGGNVGIDNTNPAYPLDVTGAGKFSSTLSVNSGTNGHAMLTILANGGKSDGQNNNNNGIQIETTGTTPVMMYMGADLGNTAGYISVKNSNGTNGELDLNYNGGQVKINNSCTHVNVTDLCYDYAEYYHSYTILDPADIVSPDENSTNSAQFIKATTIPYDQSAIGVVSSRPAVIINDGQFITGDGQLTQPTNDPPVASAGRVPVKFVSINGFVHVGDAITSSGLAGFGMKATQAGPIVGKVIEDFDPVNGKNGEGIIDCPSDAPQGAVCGKVMILLNISWYDPQAYITDTGDINIADASPSADFTIPHYYTLTDVFGNPITRVEELSQAVIGSLRAGSVQTQQLFTNSLAIATDKVTIAGLSLHDYIANIVNEVLQSNQPTITSPIASIDQIHTNLISPLASNSAIAIDLTGSQFTIRNNASGSAVATIDNTGNATFSGTLNSQNLAVNADATISGTLHAGKIVANDIEGLSAVVGTLSAQNITNVTNIYFATPSSTPAGGNFATGFGADSSTNSGVLNASGSSTLTPYLGYANLASYSGFLAYVPNLNSDTAMFNQGLVSLGATSLSDTTITGQLSIGSQLILADNSVNVLGATFEIQPLRQGGVSFEGGLLAIDTDGNLTVNGNAVFSKTLAANIISPISNDRNLTLKLGENPTATGSALATSNLTVQNASGSGVFTIDQLGNLIASGEANIGKLNLQIAQPALAVSSTEMIATGSAGTAAVKAHQVEITIDNPLVTDKSLIYITPVGQSNVTPYLIRQADKQSFTVGIPTEQLSNTTFNWLIVN